MIFFLKIIHGGEFPGSPVVGRLHFHCRGHKFIPWLGNQDPASLEAGSKKKKRLVIHGDAIEMYNALHLLLMLFLKLFGWYMDGFLIMTIA